MILSIIPLLISGITSLMKVPFVLPVKFYIGICEDWEAKHKKKRL